MSSLVQKNVFTFCVITFETIEVQTRSAPQNDCLNLSFVKNIAVEVGKLARNGQKGHFGRWVGATTGIRWIRSSSLKTLSPQIEPNWARQILDGSPIKLSYQILFSILLIFVSKARQVFNQRSTKITKDLKGIDFKASLTPLYCLRSRKAGATKHHQQLMNMLLVGHVRDPFYTWLI